MLLYPVFAYSQLINSNKSVIGEFYDAKVKSIELNGAKVVGQFRLVKFPTNYSFTDNSKVISAVKNNGFYLNLGLTLFK